MAAPVQLRATEPADRGNRQEYCGLKRAHFSTPRAELWRPSHDPKAALLVVPDGVPEPRALMTLADRDDDELVLLVSGGVRAAFDELVRRHRRRLLGGDAVCQEGGLATT